MPIEWFASVPDGRLARVLYATRWFRLRWLYSSADWIVNPMSRHLMVTDVMQVSSLFLGLSRPEPPAEEISGIERE